MKTSLITDRDSHASHNRILLPKRLCCLGEKAFRSVRESHHEFFSGPCNGQLGSAAMQIIIAQLQDEV